MSSQFAPFLATRAGSKSIRGPSRDGLVFVVALRNDLVGLKSGLGPGAREGSAVALGRKAEEVVVEGREIGKLYRCLSALICQCGALSFVSPRPLTLPRK